MQTEEEGVVAMLFKVSAEYAHHKHEESSDLGVTSPADVLKCFDEFDWAHEISEASKSEGQRRCPSRMLPVHA